LAIRYHQNSRELPAMGARSNLSKYTVKDSSSYDFIASEREIRAQAYLILPDLCNKADSLSRDFYTLERKKASGPTVGI
jgi:hypothetical protein